MTTSLEVIVETLVKLMELRETTSLPEKKRHYGNNYNGFYRLGLSYHYKMPKTFEDYYNRINGITTTEVQK
jgi:hypothetical protein